MSPVWGYAHEISPASRGYRPAWESFSALREKDGTGYISGQWRTVLPETLLVASHHGAKRLTGFLKQTKAARSVKR